MCLPSCLLIPYSRTSHPTRNWGGGRGRIFIYYLPILFLTANQNKGPKTMTQYPKTQVWRMPSPLHPWEERKSRTDQPGSTACSQVQIVPSCPSASLLGHSKRYERYCLIYQGRGVGSESSIAQRMNRCQSFAYRKNRCPQPGLCK